MQKINKPNVNTQRVSTQNVNTANISAPNINNSAHQVSHPKRSFLNNLYSAKGALLNPPAKSFVPDLAHLLNTINELFPLKSLHRRNLHHDVRDLSLILTEERGRLKTPYWAAPKFLSAYLRYFLPWTILRLAWLLPKLELNLKDDDLILDCGSGPLTLPIGLWLARPDLRRLKLEFVCSDSGAIPLEAGKKIFMAISGEKSPWKIKTVRANLVQSIEHIARSERKAALIMAGNVLNELASGQREPLDSILSKLSTNLVRALRPEGQIFVIEPGTRLGSKLIAKLRLYALRQACKVQAPCTHCEQCPLLDPSARSWCHFALPIKEIPRALSALSAAAKLLKTRASLSCLLLKTPSLEERKARFESADWDNDNDDDDFFGNDDFGDDDYGDEAPEAYAGSQSDIQEQQHRYSNKFDAKADAKLKGTKLEGRVISGPILLPHPSYALQTIEGRYLCTEHGIALVRPLNLPEGSQVSLCLTGGRDSKSGALLADPVKDTSAPEFNNANANTSQAHNNYSPDNNYPVGQATPRKSFAKAPRSHPSAREGSAREGSAREGSAREGSAREGNSRRDYAQDNARFNTQDNGQTNTQANGQTNTQANGQAQERSQRRPKNISDGSNFRGEQSQARNQDQRPKRGK